MAEFKLGDRVRRILKDNFRQGAVLSVGTVCTVTGKVGSWLIVDCYPGMSDPDFFELVEESPEPAPVQHVSSRSNDPVTSKAAGKVKRDSLRNRIKVLFTVHKYECTGHEIANYVDAPLNSVTPRLAELRREGKIKDSGQRRDKQIVWVLA